MRILAAGRWNARRSSLAALAGAAYSELRAVSAEAPCRDQPPDAQDQAINPIGPRAIEAAGLRHALVAEFGIPIIGTS